MSDSDEKDQKRNLSEEDLSTEKTLRRIFGRAGKKHEGTSNFIKKIPDWVKARKDGYFKFTGEYASSLGEKIEGWYTSMQNNIKWVSPMAAEFFNAFVARIKANFKPQDPPDAEYNASEELLNFEKLKLMKTKPEIAKELEKAGFDVAPSTVAKKKKPERKGKAEDYMTAIREVGPEFWGEQLSNGGITQ